MKRRNSCLHFSELAIVGINAIRESQLSDNCDKYSGMSLADYYAGLPPAHLRALHLI